MDTEALGSLLQYGAVGAIAVLAILALAYMTRRYIHHLEASERRQAMTSRRLVRTLRAMDDNQQTRHREVMTTLQGGGRAMPPASGRAPDSSSPPAGTPLPHLFRTESAQ